MLLRKEVHYGNRVVTCFAERPATIDAMFKGTVGRKPEAIAISGDVTRMSYSELDRAVGNVAGNLARLGFSKSDRIALLLGNRIEFLIAVLAAARIGVVIVPMSTRQKRAEVEFVLNQCTATGLIYDAAHASSIPPTSILPALKQQFVLGEGEGTPFAALLEPATAPPVAIEEEDDFCLLYTSGTTGIPKGARLTHLSVIHSVLNYRHGMALNDGEVSVLAVPASHVTGLVAILLTMISVGGTTIMMQEFKARRFLEIAASCKR